MKYRDVDPKIKRLFPWALFLVLAAAFAFAAGRVHAEEDLYACYGSSRYQAMYSSWPECNEKGAPHEKGTHHRHHRARR
jgi:hypothetical protein